MADNQTIFSIVVSKMQNEQGILLFVHWKFSLRIICFRRLFICFRCLFGRPRVNGRRLWQPGTRKAAALLVTPLVLQGIHKYKEKLVADHSYGLKGKYS